MDIDILFWIFLPVSWVLLGLALGLVEMADGNMIALPLGVAAFILSIFLGLQAREIIPESLHFSSWKHMLLVYSGLAIVSVVILRRIFHRKGKKRDINDY